MAKKQNINLLLASVWNDGLREKNQDSLLVMEIKCGKYQCVLAIVCDGIGGLQEGEQASGYVVDRMEAWFYEKAKLLKYGQITKKVGRSIERTLYQIHRELLAYGKRNGIQLGTTSSMILLIDYHYQIFHYGDSRVYECNKKRCSCITIDDVDASGRGLTKAIGIGEWNRPYVRKGNIKRGESLLLCTDGFYRKIRSEEINSVMNMHGVQDEEKITKKLNQIARILLDRGEKDNMTAIVIGREGNTIGKYVHANK